MGTAQTSFELSGNARGDYEIEPSPGPGQLEAGLVRIWYLHPDGEDATIVQPTQAMPSYVNYMDLPDGMPMQRLRLFLKDGRYTVEMDRDMMKAIHDMWDLIQQIERR